MFDEEDLRLAHSQPVNHFYEWFTAIHLFHRDRSHSLIEKYVYPSHRRKFSVYSRVLSESQRLVLDEIRGAGVQAPDLLVVASDNERFSFVEVKGPNDRLSKMQVESHNSIRARLGVPVEVVKVVLTPTGWTE